MNIDIGNEKEVEKIVTYSRSITVTIDNTFICFELFYNVEPNGYKELVYIKHKDKKSEVIEDFLELIDETLTAFGQGEHTSEIVNEICDWMQNNNINFYLDSSQRQEANES